VGDDFITRKEYDERHAALQLLFAESQGIMKNNQMQITDLIAEVRDQGKEINELRKMIAQQGQQIVATSTYNKILWPIVTISISLATYLLGFAHP
jgi:hypothetical protein